MQSLVLIVLGGGSPDNPQRLRLEALITLLPLLGVVLVNERDLVQHEGHVVVLHFGLDKFLIYKEDDRSVAGLQVVIPRAFTPVALAVASGWRNRSIQQICLVRDYCGLGGSGHWVGVHGPNEQVIWDPVASNKDSPRLVYVD